MLKDIDTVLLDLKDGFLELVPNILISLLVLGIGYLLARFIKYLVKRSIKYLGQLIGSRFNAPDLEHAASFIGVAIFWLIIFFSILLVTDILGLAILTVWFERILQYLPNVLAAILIIFAAIIIGNFIYGTIVSFASRVGMTYGTTLGRIAQSLILFTAIIIAIDQIGIEISFLINIIDIVLAGLLFGTALAFGLGARTSVSNILAAFYVRKMYKVGDYIQIGKVKGTITKIDTTNVCLDSENGQVTIPAKEFNEVTSFLINKK
ncbi:MAG: mechanosensitive ion channel domain-containing protein [Saonia sp.]